MSEYSSLNQKEKRRETFKEIRKLNISFSFLKDIYRIFKDTEKICPINTKKKNQIEIKKYSKKIEELNKEKKNLERKLEERKEYKNNLEDKNKELFNENKLIKENYGIETKRKHSLRKKIIMGALIGIIASNTGTYFISKKNKNLNNYYTVENNLNLKEDGVITFGSKEKNNLGVIIYCDNNNFFTSTYLEEFLSRKNNFEKKHGKFEKVIQNMITYICKDKIYNLNIQFNNDDEIRIETYERKI